MLNYFRSSIKSWSDLLKHVPSAVLWTCWKFVFCSSITFFLQILQPISPRLSWSSEWIKSDVLSEVIFFRGPFSPRILVSVKYSRKQNSSRGQLLGILPFRRGITLKSKCGPRLRVSFLFPLYDLDKYPHVASDGKLFFLWEFPEAALSYPVFLRTKLTSYFLIAIESRKQNYLEYF